MSVRKSVQAPQLEVTQNVNSFLLYDKRALFLRFDCSVMLRRLVFYIFLTIPNLTHCMLYHLPVVKKQNELNVLRWVFLIVPDNFIERLYIWFLSIINQN